MTKIICGVQNCYLNKDKCCCANSIDVAGKNAKNRGATSCVTFGDNKGAFSNSIQEPKEQSDISCDACNCMHNENNKCCSQVIQIHGSNVNESRATFCTTFRSK